MNKEVRKRSPSVRVRETPASPPSRPRFGAHLSIAGGLDRAIHAALRLGCDCLQIFVKNQRQWNAPPLRPDQAETFRRTRSATILSPVVAHAGYLINLASPDANGYRRSIRAMIDELHRCETLGLDALIVHPGSRLDTPLPAAVRRIARALDRIDRARTGNRTIILLETTAGQGSAVGYRFEHLAAILNEVGNPHRLGVCLDTCHLFAAGYDFRTPDGYQTMIGELEAAFPPSIVRCIHTNDSKRECGSRVDRHEHIGKGCIGKNGFAHFVRDPRWRDVPFILETPKGKDGRGTDLDKVNLKRLRELTRS